LLLLLPVVDKYEALRLRSWIVPLRRRIGDYYLRSVLDLVPEARRRMIYDEGGKKSEDVVVK
jgi:hypothetical protein